VRAAAEQGLTSDQQQCEGDAELRGFVRTLLSEWELAEMHYRGGHVAAAARQVAWRGRSYAAMAATARCIGFHAGRVVQQHTGGWCSSTAAGAGTQDAADMTGQPKEGMR
jgi:hypothetical protein